MHELKTITIIAALGWTALMMLTILCATTIALIQATIQRIKPKKQITTRQPRKIQIPARQPMQLKQLNKITDYIDLTRSTIIENLKTQR